MAAQTFSARQVARIVSQRAGKPVSDKAVRAWVRGHLTRYDDDGYTAHAYSARERDAIVNAMVAARRATTTGPAKRGTKARTASAAQGRAGTAKATRKAPKATPKASPTPDAAPEATA